MRVGKLYYHLLDQGVILSDVLELIERAKKFPSLCGVTFRGKWVSLIVPGDTERFDEMVAVGRGPQSLTDVEFLRGSETGKRYLPQFARFPGDPLALMDSRYEVKKRCEQEGRSCEGHVKVKEREREEAPQDYTEGVQLSEKVLNGLVRSELAGQTVTKRELMLTKEKIRNNATPEWKRAKGK